MSNQIIINFALKHIEELQRELKDWEHILEVYEEGDECKNLHECNEFSYNSNEPHEYVNTYEPNSNKHNNNKYLH